ncbi:pantoate--beta-alanine ligase [Lederbergia panacisoli]|uniref:pantoate--beta-alanine ligase n=1 Tax=Lederbergia panacisoli TaxID=1255251 RepID=UPI00214B5E32|nr:pantoate--beta-alanine ligase [Lederbergia panacisoli]MCR2820215.1 pantoate--beta-alanine ligase [Lederbergia panacisoli]
MEIITSTKAMQARALQLKKQGITIGFAPTMGYLHDGHIKLVKQSLENNDITVMSIFVNPLQFGPGEDFDAYPRDVKRDQKLAEEAGVNILFLPERADVYPNEPSFEINVLKRTDVLCGRSRPGHFNGVATILIKLFNIMLPDNVYFGLKDAQQVAVVDSLIKDFNFPIQLIPVETEREEDGLARSSRNVYLSEEERVHAPHLYKGLKKAADAIQNGETNPATVIHIVEDYIKTNTNGEIDYIEILSFPNLEQLKQLHGKIIIALAVKFSKARLIDNIILETQIGSRNFEV